MKSVIKESKTRPEASTAQPKMKSDIKESETQPEASSAQPKMKSNTKESGTQPPKGPSAQPTTESKTKEPETRAVAIKAEYDDDAIKVEPNDNDEPEGIPHGVNNGETSTQGATSNRATGSTPAMSPPTQKEMKKGESVGP